MVALTEQQRERYSRNLLIPEVGEAGQERLRAASVLVVGLGGLGSPAALYLTAAGVGTLGLLDSDKVELSNLQRQVLHNTHRLGQEKTLSAMALLQDLNPEVALRPLTTRLTPENADAFFAGYDVILEASDNFETKYLVNDACLRTGKPFATAGILGLSGHALFVVPGRSPCLRCVAPSEPEGVPTTAELGVLGAVPGMLGSLEAMEIIRFLCGCPGAAEGAGKLHSVDGQAMRLTTIRITRRNGCLCAPLWSST
jgi:adenylyltransferase/sulfurtransferase